MKLKALAGDVPVEISVKPDPCASQPDRHSVILAIGDSDSGTLMAYMDSWWHLAPDVGDLRAALANNADRCHGVSPEIMAVAQGLTIAAMTALIELGGT